MTALAPSVRDLGRRVGRLLVAGGVLGFLVGGIGGRLAMMVLAGLNPEATGVVSDDGFVMGQVTLSGTLNLLLAGTLLGVFGAAIYGALRPLRFGPRWFQLSAMTLGPAAVVGALLVHDGVDFTLLKPGWLSIAIFVAIPAVYGALLWVVTERWQPPGNYRLHPAVAWAGRSALAFVFLAGVAGLAFDIVEFA